MPLILVVAGMAWTIAACGDDNERSVSKSSSLPKPDISVRFDPHAAAGEKPDLPRRVGYVAFASDPFWRGLSRAMEMGANDADLEFAEGNARGDAAKYSDIQQQLITRGIAGTIVYGIDPEALAPLSEQAIKDGVAVETAGFAPSVTQLATNQRKFGELIGKAAAKYINDRLGGEAQILLLNEDKDPVVKPRYDGIRDVLRSDAPKARIVKDITPLNTAEDGNKKASAALAADPGINVILGPGLATVGAFAALEASGKAQPEMYVASVGGTDEELARIKQPASAYKATWAEPWLLIGYMTARWTNDWLDGKSIPLGVYYEPIEVTLDNLTKFQADMKDPGTVYDEGRIDEYLQLWGNISYETRDSGLTKVWNGPTN